MSYVPPPIMQAQPNMMAQFQAPPSFARAPAVAAATGAGGAYSIKENKEDAGPQEDTHACLAVDLGSSTYSACVYLADKGAVPLTGKERLPSALWLEPKSGAKGLRKWVKKDSRAQLLPKGVTVGLRDDDPKAAAAGLRLPGALRLLGLRQRPEALVREQARWPVDLTRAAAAAGSAEDDDTSGIRVCLPEDGTTAWSECEPEHLLAVLLTSLKLKAAAGLKVECVTCYLTGMLLTYLERCCVPIWLR
jgi:hypothetical protein